MERKHGGDWVGFQEKYGELPLDFSVNVNPFGLSEGVKQAAIRALDMADRYPDPQCRALRRALAEYHGLRPEQILCGNGAADLIFRLALAKRPARALVTAPTFGEYERALEQVGCEVEHFFLREETDFSVAEELLEHISPGLEMLMLCEPNNPTGRTTEHRLLLEILERCAQCGTLLVVDECFNEFLSLPEAHSLVRWVAEYPNLLIFRAFTKCYAMAGLRLGYALCGDEKLLEKMEVCGPPWPVSTVAQAAGLAALGESETFVQLHALLERERPRLQRELEELGCRVIPGEANYLLFRCEQRNLAKTLEKNGILIRTCGEFAGLDEHWYRVCVRTGKENQRLLDAMRKAL